MSLRFDGAWVWISAVLVLLSADLFGQTATDAAALLAAAKKVRIEVSQSYRNGEEVLDRISLPAAALASKILRYAGLTIVDNAAEESDLLLSITINGEAKSAEYMGVGRRSTGAAVKGTIGFRRGDNVVELTFEGSKDPPGIVSEPYPNPFADALGVSGFYSDILNSVGKAFGSAPLIKALADKEETLRVESATALAGLKDAAAREALIHALKDNSLEVRDAAETALLDFGRVAPTDPAALKIEDWTSIAISADGSRLAACVYSGDIYTSTDGGNTWTDRTTAGKRSWYSITSSADGNLLAACVFDGDIYTSRDGGVTWTDQKAAGSGYWSAIASSSDGVRLIACAGGKNVSGDISTSVDGGSSWTDQTAAGKRSWTAVACSSDGSRVAACVYGDDIHTNAAYGAGAWSRHTVGGSLQFWRAIASSADGKLLVAAEKDGGVYTSANGGASWKRRSPGSSDPCSVALSANGKCIAVCGTEYIYISTDGGANWTIRRAGWRRILTSISSSSSGKRLAACAEGNKSVGGVYTSTDGGATWIYQAGAGSQ